MSQPLTIEIDDSVYEAICEQAGATGASPAQVAALALQRVFNGSRKPSAWPDGFFEKIRIDDPTFKRPDQGQMPPSPVLG